MLLDLTLAIDRTAAADDHPLRKLGHLGTHFDVLDKEFPLEYVKRTGRLIDISTIKDREVVIEDLHAAISPEDFVIFRTNLAIDVGYGAPEYNRRSAELSDDAVGFLLDRNISLIGVDAASIQKPSKHLEVDHRCAERNVFVVENLCNLEKLAPIVGDRPFVVYCAPLNFRGLTGLPCRVVADTGG
jgi:kynurenine formamidase